MHGLNSKDYDNKIDWGLTSEDYAKYRPGPPLSFYEKLHSLDVGSTSQSILDLGTGTGVIAREFSKRGVSKVIGTDISLEQIKVAQRLTQVSNLNTEFYVAEAESQPFENNNFDVITANQCWLYFDIKKIIPEVKRLIKPNGLLVVSYFNWLPLQDDIAKKTEELILKYNPKWTAAGYKGDIPAFPTWAEGHFKLKGMFYYDEQIPFNYKTWRGRIRASRGVGATLTQNVVEKFDHELDSLLKELTTDNFQILHRIDTHIFTF